MCRNLVEKANLDTPLILYNRTKKRSHDLSASLGPDKTKVVETITEAVEGADIVFMCLGDDAAVNSAVDVILETDINGKLIVDASTVHPDTSNALEKRLTAKGAEFVAMPGNTPSTTTPAEILIPNHSFRCSRNGRLGEPHLCSRWFCLGGSEGEAFYEGRHGPRRH